LLKERTGAGVPMEAAYLELVEGRLIQDGVDRLEAAGVTDLLAIPFSFLPAACMCGKSAGRWAPATNRKAKRTWSRCGFARGSPTAVPSTTTRKSRTRAGQDRSVSADPANEAVLLIGHGNAEPEMHRAWLRGMAGLAERIRARGGYAAADFALLKTDDLAEKAESLRRGFPSCRVLAVPVFLSEGYFTAEAVPRRLQGAPCDYAETALLPHPKLAEWIARQSAEWLAQLR